MVKHELPTVADLLIRERVTLGLVESDSSTMGSRNSWRSWRGMGV